MRQKSGTRPKPVTTVYLGGELLELLRHAAGERKIGDFVRECVTREAQRSLNLHPHINGAAVVYAEDFFATLERIEGLAERIEELSAGQAKSLETLCAFAERSTKITEDIAGNTMVLVESMQFLLRLLITDSSQLVTELEGINARAQIHFDTLMQTVKPSARSMS